MLAENVLLGRARVVPAQALHAATGEGSGVLRALLNALLVAVIVFEASSVDTLLAFGGYIHRGLGSWTDVPLPLSPLEILLIVGVVIALVTSVLEPAAQRGWALGWPLLTFVVALLLGFVRGAFAGGDMYVGLWELRYLLYVPACFLIVRASIRRREHVSSLLWTGLLSAGVLAVLGAYRKLALINTGALGFAPEFFYEHEDVIFLASFLTLAFSTVFLRARAGARTLGLLLAPVLLYTLLASNRRSGVIVLLVGLVLAELIVFAVRKKAFFASTIPVLATAVLYVAMFWNASGVLGQPARAIRSLSEPDPRDAASNFYRFLETYDIVYTIRAEPLLGVGFGREFNMVVPLPDLSWWPFWRYEPHNNVLWIWLKTGAAGYVLFWFLIGSALCRAACVAKRVLDPGLRVAALFCLVALVGVVVFAYVDLGFVSGRVTVFFGTVLGLIGVLPAIDRPLERLPVRT